MVSLPWGRCERPGAARRRRGSKKTPGSHKTPGSKRTHGPPQTCGFAEDSRISDAVSAALAPRVLQQHARARSASWIVVTRPWHDQISIETEDRSGRNSARPSARWASGRKVRATLHAGHGGDKEKNHARARSASWIVVTRPWHDQISIETEDRSGRNSARPSARCASGQVGRHIVGDGPDGNTNKPPDLFLRRHVHGN